MREKIALVFRGNVDFRKGEFNANIARIKSLLNSTRHDVDVYIVQTYEGWITRKLRHTQKQEKKEIYNIDGIQIRSLWVDFSLIDHVLSLKFHRKTIFTQREFKKLAGIFECYDLICFLSNLPLVNILYEKYKKPFTITWHGSDIHTDPFSSKIIFENTKFVIEHAEVNYFVSKALLKTSSLITEKGKKMLAYNGVNKEHFFRFSDEKREAEMKNNAMSSDYINIGFCGNLFTVKNVSCLPKVFSLIQKRLPNARFYIAGDGKLRKELECGFAKEKISVVFFGDRKPSEMPGLLNCLDLVVLPSKNEGLPLILVEALACGIRCVAAKVGGIPEVLPNEYCVEHGERFEERFANACINALKNPVPKIPDYIDWEKTALIESKCIDTILDNEPK